MQRYFGHLSSFDDLCNEFRISNEVQDNQIVFAGYFTESYEGSAVVLFFNNFGINIVEGSHCSCNGLEGQWKPQLMNWGALDMKMFNYVKDPLASSTLNAIIDAKPNQENWIRIVETHHVLSS